VNENMEEIITLDGKQFKLMSNRPLTSLERQQAILDIRKQSGCSSCNKTKSLINNMQTSTEACVGVAILASNVAITDVTIGASCVGGTCPDITCTELNCKSIAENVVVRFTNSGDADADIIPTLLVDNAPPIDATGALVVPSESVPLRVSASGGTATATFEKVVLVAGQNTVCADFTTA
jgi:hypothetical protein